MPPKDTRNRHRISIDIQQTLHAAMRELARRHRVPVGSLYDDALRAYIQKPENYLGAGYLSQLERTIEHGN